MPETVEVRFPGEEGDSEATGLYDDPLGGDWGAEAKASGGWLDDLLPRKGRSADNGSGEGIAPAGIRVVEAGDDGL